MHANIRLREVEPGDLPAFFLHQRDSEAVAMAAFTSRDAPAFELHWAKILADETGLKKTIVVVSADFAAPDTVAGNIVSWNSEAKREFGYWIDRAYWGHGVATAALSAFLRLEQTRPLYAGVAKHNAASLRVLQKCGFKLLPSAKQECADTDKTHLLLVLREEDSI